VKLLELTECVSLIRHGKVAVKKYSTTLLYVYSIVPSVVEQLELKEITKCVSPVGLGKVTVYKYPLQYYVCTD